jgi:hypothetical protein
MAASDTDLEKEIRRKKLGDLLSFESIEDQPPSPSKSDYPASQQEQQSPPDQQKLPEQTYVLTPVAAAGGEGDSGPGVFQTETRQFVGAAGATPQAPAQPGAVPSPLPPPSLEHSDNLGPVEGELGTSDPFEKYLQQLEEEPEVRRAQLVKLPPSQPVAAASRELDLAPAAELVKLPPEPIPTGRAPLEGELGPVDPFEKYLQELETVPAPPVTEKATPPPLTDEEQRLFNADPAKLSPADQKRQTDLIARQAALTEAAVPPTEKAATVPQPPAERTYDLTPVDEHGNPVPGALPAGAAPPVKQGNTLTDIRSRFDTELGDPRTAQLLMASTYAEVGNQGPEAQLAYIESVMNRASAQNRSLASVLTDTHYYPDTTIRRLNQTFKGSAYKYLRGLIVQALDGSNQSNFATGNESGDVHSHGAYVSYNPKTGERFVQEKGTEDWVRSVSSGAAQVSGQSYELTPASGPSADQAKAIAGSQAAIQAKIQALPEFQNQSAIGLYKRLNDPVEGVSTEYSNWYQRQLKAQITQEAQKFYNIKDPDEAFKRASSDADFGSVASELSRNVMGNLTKIDVMMGQASQETDSNRVGSFVQAVHPDFTPDQRAKFVQDLLAMEPAQRAIAINTLHSGLPPDLANVINPTDVADSADRMANPEYQKQVSSAIAAKKREVAADLAADPRLAGTPMDKAIQMVGPIPSQVLLALPSMTGAPVGEILTNSLFAAQIHADTYDSLKAEHPDWNENQLQEMTNKVTAVSLLPQILLTRIHSGELGKTIAAATEGSLFQRIVGNIAIHQGGAAGAAAAGQAATNIVQGKPVGEGVGEAAVAGAVQAIPGAAIGFFKGRRAPGVRPDSVTAPPTSESRRPPLVTPDTPPDTGTVHVAGGNKIEAGSRLEGESGKDYTRTDAEGNPIGQSTVDPETGRRRTVIANALADWTITQQPDGTWHLHVPDGSDTGSTKSVRVFDSFENAARARDTLKAGEAPPTPREGEVPSIQTEPSKTQSPVTGSDVARLAYLNGQERAARGEPGTPLDDLTKAQKDLSAGDVKRPVTQGMDEPWVSAVANRLTANRMARGEIGTVAPEEGVSREALLNEGLRMGPEEINQQISDLMNKTGDIRKQAAAVRAQEAQLSQRSHAASLAWERNPTPENLAAREEAFNDLTDFHKGPMAQAKLNFHMQGMGLQGEIPVDLSTFNGLREEFLKNNPGKSLRASDERNLVKTAEMIRNATITERAALENLGKEIDRQTRGKPMISDSDLRRQIMEIMQIDPCSR